MRPGMSPGGAKSGASGSNSERNAGAFSASFTMSTKDSACPLRSHSRLHSCMIHSPITFLSTRMVPSTPPSLVRFAACASGEITGCFVSTPTSDHVPLEM